MAPGDFHIKNYHESNYFTGNKLLLKTSIVRVWEMVNYLGIADSSR